MQSNEALIWIQTTKDNSSLSLNLSEICSTIHQPFTPNVKDGVPYLRAHYITYLLLNYACSPLTLIEIESWEVAADTLPHLSLSTHTHTHYSSNIS